MAPVVDGPYSIEVYFSCLDACQRQIGERAGFVNFIESHDYLVYHLGEAVKD
jgi:3-hydroxy-3-methylglutaryl CoA synthase